MKYNSPPTTIDKQIGILESRGMIIADKELATDFLNKVSYYRFVGYALHYEHFEDRNRTHKYKAGTTFEDVVSLYYFDDKLRSILFDAITHVEVAFRTQICLHMALKTNDSHWQLNKRHVNAQFNHEKFMEEIEKEINRSHEIFIKSYREKYTVPELPASWMMIEIISFGNWSKLYKSLEDKEVKKDVADYFNLKPYQLESWIQSITAIRNICAHHGRLWNLSLTTQPFITKKMKKVYNPVQQKKIVVVLDVISELLKPLNEYDDFIHNLNNLFNQYPHIPITSTGLKIIPINPTLGVRV